MVTEQVHTIIDKLIANQEIKNILFNQIKEKPAICGERKAIVKRIENTDYADSIYGKVSDSRSPLQ